MRKPEKIVPIILAAGSSQGLPFPKALALFGGKTALDIAIANCAALGRPLVVLGCDANIIQRAIPKSARIVINRRWRKGQLSSLQAALKKIPTRDAFLIYPVDHALIRPGAIKQLVRSFATRSPAQEIVMPRHKTAYGHPVIISAAVRAEFFGAATAREVIYSVPERIRVVEAKTSAIFEDFNSPETYDHVREKFRNVRRL